MLLCTYSYLIFIWFYKSLKKNKPKIWGQYRGLEKQIAACFANLGGIYKIFTAIVAFKLWNNYLVFFIIAILKENLFFQFQSNINFSCLWCLDDLMIIRFNNGKYLLFMS